MNFKLYLAICFCIFLGTSCQNPSEEQVQEIIIPDDFPNRTSMDPLIEDCEFVVLETNPESMIQDLSRVLVINDTIVVGDFRQGNILLFRRDGSFIRRISHIGKGPGEYVRMASLAYDAKNRELLVLDMSTQSVKRYTLDDRIGKSEKFEIFDAGTDLVFFDDFYVFMRDCNRFPNNPNHNISVLNRNFDYVTSGGIIPGKILDYYMSNNCWYDEHLGELFMHLVCSDTIFSLGKEGCITPRYVIRMPESSDVKQSEIWKRKHQDMVAFTKEALFAHKTWHFNLVLMMDDYIFIYFGGGGINYCVYWRDTGMLSLRRSPHFTKEKLFLYIIGKDRDRLIAQIFQPTEFEKLSKVIGDVIPEDNNPVLCFIKLKEKP